MSPETQLLLALVVGLLVTASSVAWDIWKGKTTPLIGRSYIRSEEPRAFWSALVAANLIYLAVVIWVVMTGLSAAKG